ncbi:MAG: PHP domain-containing protein [Clostridia bacterium]|nr:PHP domain-containing protein [Clostridia bacterium]
MQNFNYHSHTYRCGHADLDMEDEEYVKEYIKMGFKKVAFTDHCPEKNRIDVRKNMRMDYDRRIEYLNSIKFLKEKYKTKIELETGYEVEYLPGEEENLRELKLETDKLILGQHFIYDDNKNLKIFGGATIFLDKELIRYAEYLEKAMEYHIPNIIAHPDIFMLNSAKFGEIEEKITHKICKAVEKYNVPLEINLNKIYALKYYKNIDLDRLTKEERQKAFRKAKYPCREFWNIVKDYNIKVLYGIDAHHRGQILRWNELVEYGKEALGEEIISKLNFVKNEENI